MLNRFKRLFSRNARKSSVLDGTGLVSSVPDRDAVGLTRTQQAFLQWNAQRLGISLAESQRRYAQSMAAVAGGHAGRAYHQFNLLAHNVFRVFFDDNRSEVFDAYRYHGPMHFLMMLTYPEPHWRESDLIVQELLKRPRVSILDFGCGLAQQSRTLAQYLKERGVPVELALADIPTLREDFLLWWGRNTGIATTFLACTAQHPIPDLPQIDICQATEFFEHVHDPVSYFRRIDEKLSPGGLLVTGIMDHHADFLHVSPQLGALREAISACGYEALVVDRVLRKPPRAGTP